MYSWVSSVMPFLEEASLYDTVDWLVPLGVRNAQVPPDTSHHIPFETYFCPSDLRVGITNSWYGARGNYAGNVGIGVIYMNDTSPTQDCAFAHLNTGYSCKKGPHWPPTQRNPKYPNSSLKAFGTFMVNKGRRMAEFPDGTSKTAAISEVRNIPGQDTRGVLHFGAGVLYMHDYPPNYVDLPDRTRWCPLDAPDYAPCQPTDEEWKGRWRHFARSGHPNGVNLLMVDTNGRFVSDDVDPLLWNAIGTAEGEEVISDSF
jgi:hypothetical protein